MIEIKHLRTRNTATWQNPDGSFTQRAYGSDIHYDNWRGLGDGVTGLRKCDPLLVTQRDGSVIVEFMPYTATFPAVSDGAFEFRDARKGIDLAYTMQPTGIESAPAKVDGDSVIYPNAYGAGCDLVYTLRASGVAKLVKVQPEYTAQKSFSFMVSLPKGTTIKRAKGAKSYTIDRTGPKVTDSDRLTVFERDGVETYLYPFRWRSGIDRGVLPVQIENAGGDRWLFTKTIPPEWTRELPLSIDLTASGTILADGYLGGAGFSTYLLCVNANPGSSGQTVLGADPAIMTYRKGSATRYCVRGIVDFTNTVPPTAINITIDLGVVIATAGADTVRVVDFTPDDYAAPDHFDYCSASGANPVHIFDTLLATALDVSSTGAKTISLNAAGLADFVPNGNNGYAFRASVYDVGAGSSYTGAAVYSEYRTSENATPGNRPSQTITYTMPAVTNIPGALGQLAAIKSLGVLAA